MSFYSDQAGQFEQMAADIQARLTNQGASMDDATYSSLAEQRDALLDKANAMVIADLQATLEQLEIDQTQLAQCTATLVDAMKKVKAFDKYAALVAAAVTLATAIASADPGAIASAIAGAVKAVASAVAKPESPATGATGSATGSATGN